MSSLFLNIICEEIPARMQKNAAFDLQKLLVGALSDAGLAPQNATLFYGPRHLSIAIDEMLAAQPDRQIEKRGPRSDAPDKAIEGFCQSAGITRDELIQEETEKGTFFFARKDEKGQLATTLLPQIINDILGQFPWPKSQRWGTSRTSWVRPMHGINLLFDGKLITGAFDLGGDMSIAYSDVAFGHRFHAPDGFSFQSVDEWQAGLKERFVMADADERSALIAAEATEKAAAFDVVPIADDGLLAEVTGLVEWPNVIIGKIDDTFMTLPEEVLITSMRVHQKYFATRYLSGAQKGQIAPYFITVANRQSHPEHDQLIAHGNERVLRARLADAAFFCDQDKASKLDSYLPALDKITFYDGLGSVGDKAGRIAKLAASIAGHIDGADAARSELAASLAKADLVTDMVGEFPELQGLMGGYYASHHGYEAAICTAISDHYRPAGPSDRLPENPDGLAVSLADKIDTLVGFFGIGAKPTGSKDPFALRRAALSVLRMISEKELSLPLASLMSEAAKAYGFETFDSDLPSFITDRLRVMLRDEGISHDIVAAALAASHSDNPYMMVMKARLLDDALGNQAGASLLAGFRRANNILAAEAKKSGNDGRNIDRNGDHGAIKTDYLVADEEKALYEALSAVPQNQMITEAEIRQTMTALSGLETPINAFFDKIIVNDDDDTIRQNRLALLQKIIHLMSDIADFSKIEK